MLPTDPNTQEFSTQPTPPKKRHRIRNTLITIGGLIIAIIVIALAVGGSSEPIVSPPPHVYNTPSLTTTTYTDPNGVLCVESTTVDSYCPGDTPTPEASPTTPSMTGDQEQAVESAQGYLDDGQGFSYKGLLDQLTSNYGEGFSRSDAKFAINYLHPNWKEQAVESARGYLSDGQGFSRQGLLDQLTSSYGEGFTEAQAEYAVNKTMG